MLTKIKLADKIYANSIDSIGNKTSELINKLFQNIPNISFIKDKNFRYIEVNDAFANLLGLKRSKIIDKTDFEIFDKETAGIIRANDKKVFSKRGNIDVEEICIVKGTSTRLKFCKVPLLDDNGSVIGIGGIGEDITFQTSKDEAMERKRIRILSIIAHDLKNPFNSILGIADLLKSHLSEYSFSEICQLVNALDNSSKKAVDLFDNMLNWTISSWKDDSLLCEMVNLKSLVDEIIQPLNLSAHEKNISIYNHVEENTNISLDINTVSAVIRNLVNNSIKFTNSEGEVNINSILMEEIIEIIISDNGVGISDEEIETLFKMDCNKSNIGTFNEKGMGLGLLVCKEFVDKNGGKIWAEKRNQGSEFHFTIPR